MATATKAQPVTAKDLIERLRTRYPLPEWMGFAELRNATGYQGKTRYADFVAMNAYPSKGNLSVAVEVKVSRSDFTRELADPSKRAWLEESFAECWFCAPKDLIKPSELPEGWGLFEVWGDKLRVKARAKQDLSRRPDYSVMMSVMRRVASEREAWRLGSDNFAEFQGRPVSTGDLMRLAKKLSLLHGQRAPARQCYDYDARGRRKVLANDWISKWQEFMVRLRQACGEGYPHRREVTPAMAAGWLRKLKTRCDAAERADALPKMLREIADQIDGSSK